MLTLFLIFSLFFVLYVREKLEVSEMDIDYYCLSAVNVVLLSDCMLCERG